MLYLIGIGLKPRQLTLEAIDAIKSSEAVFLEGYTSQYAQGTLDELVQLTGKTIKLLGRKEVEEQFESALASAQSNNISLLIVGNALTATTHIQVLLDCREKGIKYKVIPGISVTNTIAETGLDEYKFGRTVTICYHTKDFTPDSFFDQIRENQKVGLHTLCLLDIKKDENPQRMMNCGEAIEVLATIAKKKKIKKEFSYIGLLGMASEKQKILVGKEKIVSEKELYAIYPQTLIVVGKLNDKEKECLEKLHA